MLALLAALVAFLIGSIPTGVIVARYKGVDLRRVGSGNIGATNVGRALGKGWAAFVLIADATKGALPVVVLGWISANPWLPALGGLAAVAGQIFSVFLRGRGGKGVATSLGAGIALAPPAALACLASFLLVYLIFRFVSLGSLAAMASFPFFLWVFGMVTWPRLTFAVAVAVLITARHKDNLIRLAQGGEHRA